MTHDHGASNVYRPELAAIVDLILRVHADPGTSANPGGGVVESDETNNERLFEFTVVF